VNLAKNAEFLLASGLAMMSAPPFQRGMMVVRPVSSIIIQRRPLLSSK
jgi:hypothetical protein